MIRINLLRSTGMSASAPVMAGLGGSAVVVDDQQKIGGLKLLAMLALPVLLYAYEYSNLSSLESQKQQAEAQAAAVEAKRAAYGDAGPKVEKYTKEKQRIDSQLGTIRELSKSRLREVKALDSIQSLTPSQVWFDSIKIEGDLVKAAGYSTTSEGLDGLFEALRISPVFSNFEPRSQGESQSTSGQVIKKFEVEFTIGSKRQENP